MNNAKKQRKTIEWERLEISSRKLKRSGNISCKDGQIDGGKVEIVTDFIFLGSKITVDGDCMATMTDYFGGLQNHSWLPWWLRG